MTKIHVLDSLTANSIVAGEVVERPSSVVKELVENSLDAGASVISVEILQGGIKLIRVSDNGTGLDSDDARLAFLRHATSKLNIIDDLEQLVTMGFRGEALASIAAVSQVSLFTRQPEADEGIELRVEAGDIVFESVSGCSVGTTISVENLFYNTPARYKFLKRDQTEASYITDLIERMALARPDVSFRLFNQGQEILHTPGNNDLLSSIFAVYGKNTARASLPILFAEEPVAINGYIASPEITRHNRNRQNIFVNGRLIKSKMITAALDEACNTWFMKNKYPTLVININLPAALVDVNVHPQKMEVRFWDERKIFHCIYHAVRQALIDYSGIPGNDDDSESSENEMVKNTPVDKIAPQLTQTELPFTVSVDNSHLQEAEQADWSAEQAKELIYQSSDNIQTNENIEFSDDNLSLTESQSAPMSVSDHMFVNEANGNRSNEKSNDNYEVSYNKTEVEGNNSKINELMHARIIGQAFQTYLILECNQELYMVDQHAAHERIIYERLVNRNSMRTDDINRQPLLVPEPVQVSRSEKQKILDVEGDLLQLGFEFDDFGPETLLLRSVPGEAGNLINAGAAFRTAADTLIEGNISGPEAVKHVYENIACKAAVKAHDLLHESEMIKLLQDLQQLENPYHCPHGRPIIVRMSKYELEKKFKRIV
jgi:DNA mismatch repair protein MutL